MSADLILSIPAFFRTAQGTYWHRPRSATSQLYGWCFTAWCGATTRGEATWTDTPNSDVCGTCQGRRDGADPTTSGTIFTPRGTHPPARCPGSDRFDNAYTPAGHRVARCLVCHELVPLRTKGGPYDPREGLAAHPPGEGISNTRCGIHGWSDLTIRGGRVECRCGPVGGDPS